MSNAAAMCLVCRKSFTAAEIAAATVCPACGSDGVPADPSKTHTLTLTDLEWRVLFMWAENWESHIKLQRPVVGGIAREAKRQQPTLPAISLHEEGQEIATLTGRPTQVIGSGGHAADFSPETRH